MTLFTTPIISSLLRLLALLCMKLIGWRLEDKPPQVKKCVIIAAPHTSNWDFPMMLAVVLIHRMDVRWMGKNTLFPWYIGWLMKYLGGIPIDRSKSNNMIELMADEMKSRDSGVLLITPEGTRSKVNKWKSGFYHIAQEAELPIGLAYVDSRTKIVGFFDTFIPSGDYDTDIIKIQKLYEGKQGLKPSLT